jgi:hypothetical protein
MPNHRSTSNPAVERTPLVAQPQALPTTPERSQSISASEDSSSSEVRANDALAITAPTRAADSVAGDAPVVKKRRTKKGERDAAKAVRRRRRPGFTDRKHRREVEKAVIRARLEDDEPGLTPEALEACVDEEYAKLLPTDAKVIKAFEETAPVSACPNRRNIFGFIEAKAIQDLDETRELLDRLRINPYGRPTDRRLMAAVFLRNFLENGRPELHCHWKQFKTADVPTAWAYGYPGRKGSWRDQSNVNRTLHSTLLRVDPQITIRLNIQALIKLRDEIGDPDIGRYLLIDGTDIVAPREQSPTDPNYPVEENLRKRGLNGAEFTTHGYFKSWRGYKLIYLVDVKTGLPIAYMLLSGKRAEWQGLRELLLQVHALWQEFAGEPWEPEYLVGDGHFDARDVHEMLEAQFAIHPAFGRGTELGKEHDWHDNEGVPYCVGHGKNPDGTAIKRSMKLVQSEGFVDHAKRRELGLAPGDAADLKAARMRWVCTGVVTNEDGTSHVCGLKATTHWSKNPRAHTYLPFRGEHNRAALRTVLLLRRNMVESLNARLKGRGIGNKGMNVPKWVSEDREMEWLCFATSLSFTLQRLAHLTGTYDAAHQEADSMKLLTPVQPPMASALAGSGTPRTPVITASSS